MAGLQALGVNFNLPDDPELLAALGLADRSTTGTAATAGGEPGEYDIVVGCVKLGNDEPSCRLRWPAHALLKVCAGPRVCLLRGGGAAARICL